MPTTLTTSSIVFPDGTTDSTSSIEPILRYQASILGNSGSNSASTLQYLDITCDASSPCPIMIINYDYWVSWPGWSDIYFSTYDNCQTYGDRFKTRPDNRDFIRCHWINGPLGGPHIAKISLFYYS